MDAKSSDYEQAERFEYTFKLRMINLLRFVKLYFVICWMLIPETLKGIWRLIVSPKPKCVKDQVALVTGAGNGLGRAIAFRLAKENCKLAIVDIDFFAAQQTAKDIATKFGVQAQAFKVDVSKYEEIMKLKEDVEASLGKVDILVNNAGLLCLKLSLREGTPEQIQNTVNVNLLSHFWVSIDEANFIL